MSLGETEYINRIQILDSGELFLGIEGEGKATELKDWTPSDWFFHIVDIVQMGLGVRLVLRRSVLWEGLSDKDMAIITKANHG